VACVRRFSVRGVEVIDRSFRELQIFSTDGAQSPRLAVPWKQRTGNGGKFIETRVGNDEPSQKVGVFAGSVLSISMNRAAHFERCRRKQSGVIDDSRQKSAQ
jgi:hypothetical protein